MCGKSRDIHDVVTDILGSAVGDGYASQIGEDEGFVEAVWEDVRAASDWENNGRYNDDDVRLAIGRILLYKLGIWC